MIPWHNAATASSQFRCVLFCSTIHSGYHCSSDPVQIQPLKTNSFSQKQTQNWLATSVVGCDCAPKGLMRPRQFQKSIMCHWNSVCLWFLEKINAAIRKATGFNEVSHSLMFEINGCVKFVSFVEKVWLEEGLCLTPPLQLTKRMATKEKACAIAPAQCVHWAQMATTITCKSSTKEPPPKKKQGRRG